MRDVDDKAAALTAASHSPVSPVSNQLTGVVIETNDYLNSRRARQIAILGGRVLFRLRGVETSLAFRGRTAFRES